MVEVSTNARSHRRLAYALILLGCLMAAVPMWFATWALLLWPLKAAALLVAGYLVGSERRGLPRILVTAAVLAMFFSLTWSTAGRPIWEPWLLAQFPEGMQVPDMGFWTLLRGGVGPAVEAVLDVFAYLFMGWIAYAVVDWRKSRRPVAARPPGWYEDPALRHSLRYWDGADWTGTVSDHDPL